jgi:hypothetical protein
VPLRLGRYVHKLLATLLCAAAVFAAGCHSPSNISYYGIAWIDVTNQPGDYLSYIVTIDSITMTRSDGVVVTAAGTPEIVDLAQVKNYSELWSAESIPDGTYTSATITLDYTNAVITVMVNGKPVQATLVDALATSTTTPTTYSIEVNFDSAHQPTITPTYASTSAVLVSLDFDLAASGYIDFSTSPAPTVHVRPVVSVGMQAPDTKLVRVRGPLVNSSTNVNTYTVDIRPFYDEANNIGTVTLFNQPNTVYTLNGQSYVGNPGLAALSVLSAGITMTAGFTTFQTDYNPLNGATAGRFNLQYVVAGSTLEDNYTNGVTGDVIARNGNTLTVQGATLILTTADSFEYQTTNTTVLLGSETIVTADDNSRLTSLGVDDIAVGQHITARGVLTVLGPPATLDSTGIEATTGSVRLQPTELWGSLVSSASDTATLDVQTINGWPASDFTFTGNGATAPSPAAFLVNTALTGLPAGVAAGDPIWISGYMAPFGAAPPDFTAYAANDQTSVQIAGGAVGGGVPTTPGNEICGTGSQVCTPALLSVVWNAASKVSTPFTSVSSAGFTIDPTKVLSAVIQIGPQTIDLTSSSVTSPMVVATSLPATSIFAPRFMVGNPANATTTATVVPTSIVPFATYSNMADYVTTLQTQLTASAPALQLAARGIYNATTNTFTATTIDFVL